MHPALQSSEPAPTSPGWPRLAIQLKWREILASAVVLASLGVGYLSVRDRLHPYQSHLSSLVSGSIRERRQAARWLGQVKPADSARAIADLPHALHDHDAIVRTEAARSMGRLMENAIRHGQTFTPQVMESTQKALESALADPDPSVREVSVRALGMLSAYTPHPPVSILQVLNEDPEPIVRVAAAEALLYFGSVDAPIIKSLIEGMEGPDPDLRTVCSDCLSRLTPSPDALAILIDAAKKSDTELRIRAAELLTRLGPTAAAAIPALIEMLSSSIPAGSNDPNLPRAHTDPAWAAAIALSQIAPRSPQRKEVVQALRRALKSPNDERVTAAATALVAFDSDAREAVPELIQVLNRALEKPMPGSTLGPTITIAIGDLATRSPHEKEAVDILRRALKSPDEITRSRAAVSLGKLGQAALPALPDLRAVGNDPSIGVRYEAGRAIYLIQPHP